MITLYTTPNCPWCDRAKQHLERANIAYTPVDVSQDESALAKLRALGHRSMPQIFVGDVQLVDGAQSLMRMSVDQIHDRLDDIEDQQVA